MRRTTQTVLMLGPWWVWWPHWRSAPCTWSVATGQLPPSVSLQNSSAGRDASDQPAGPPAAAGIHAFTVRVTGRGGPQAARRFTLAI